MKFISAASLCLCIFLYFIVFLHKSRSVVSERVFSFFVFLCMSPTELGYKELGLDLVEPLQDQPRKPLQPPMVEEKKEEGAGDPIKILLQEALEKQRNAIMDNFTQILQRLPTYGASASNNNFGRATPFKVQVNFDIPIFEG